MRLVTRDDTRGTSQSRMREESVITHDVLPDPDFRRPEIEGVGLHRAHAQRPGGPIDAAAGARWLGPGRAGSRLEGSRLLDGDSDLRRGWPPSISPTRVETARAMRDSPFGIEARGRCLRAFNVCV